MLKQKGLHMSVLFPVGYIRLITDRSSRWGGHRRIGALTRTPPKVVGGARQAAFGRACHWIGLADSPRNHSRIKLVMCQKEANAGLPSLSFFQSIAIPGLPLKFLPHSDFGPTQGIQLWSKA